MKQAANVTQLFGLSYSTKKVIYNKVSNLYTLLDQYNETLAQFDLNTMMCVIKDVGYFMHYTDEQLKGLLKSKKIIEIGGRRAYNDSIKKSRNT